MGSERLCLIGGGARSGKSGFALKLASERGTRRAFVATAQAYDEEMRARIAAHRAERSGFATFEAPEDLCSTLRQVTEFDVVLIDCLTLYLSNALLRNETARLKTHASETEAQRLSAAAAAVELELGRVLQGLADVAAQVIVVTNEVGQGIVPANALARCFRDLAGRANQQFARQADELYLAIFGQVLRLKPQPLVVLGE